MPSRRDRLGLVAAFLLCAAACAEGVSSGPSYTLVDRKGERIGSSAGDAARGVLLRRLGPDGSVKDFRIPEFDTLARKHDFAFQLASDAFISSRQGDYFVVEAMRSIAMNPAEDADYVRHRLWWNYRCGHGVNLTYLVGVAGNKARIVKRHLTQCTFESRRVDHDGQAGFMVKGHGDDDAGRAVLYLLQQDGSFVKKIGGPYRERE